jgi:hypothetical protein
LPTRITLFTPAMSPLLFLEDSYKPSATAVQ